MTDYSFIPENNVRKTADHQVVALFLQAILKQGYYNTYPMVGVSDVLTKDGTFVKSSMSMIMSPNDNVVSVLDCDLQEAWRVLREKGYHLRIYDSTYAVDKTKWAKPSDRCGYYFF